MILILCLPFKDNELLDLNIEVYQQEVLEKGILNQVDEAFEKELQKKKSKLENRSKKIKKVSNVPKTSDNEGKEESLSTSVGMVPLEETERERKIRMGEMTPFGTFVSVKSSEM